MYYLYIIMANENIIMTKKSIIMAHEVKNRAKKAVFMAENTKMIAFSP
jgi:hypothetical protein